MSMLLNCPALPNIPWQDRPADATGPIWRYSENPIVTRDAVPLANSIFNSAAVPFEGKFAGVFRCDNTQVRMNLHAGFSEDGINWDINPEPINWPMDNPDWEAYSEGYDPRVVWIEDRYYIIWCNMFHGPTIGLGWTKDFKEFHFIENALLPYNRNGVLFPRKINDDYVMLSRPSDTGHTAFGNIFLSHSKDIVHWGRHRFVMGTDQPWESTKIGAGPAPIETKEGWLMIYHGVLMTCNGYVYRMGAALLDLEKPWKVVARAKPYILAPQELYECVGDVPNVTFPCAALVDGDTDRLAIYYGCADTVTGLAFAKVDELVAWILENSD